MPRCRILDHAKRGAACALVAAGYNLTEVAERIGCSRRTLSRERARNGDFRVRLEEAELLSGREPLEHLRRAARSNWRAAAWLLERSDPQQFAPRRPAPCRPAELEAACNRLIETALEEVADPAERRRLYQRLSDAAANAARQLFDPGAARSRDRRAAPLSADLGWRLEIEGAAQQLAANWPDAAPEGTEWSTNADVMETESDNNGQNGDTTRARFFGNFAERLRKSAAKRAAESADQAPELSTKFPSQDNQATPAAATANQPLTTDH